MVTDYIDIDRKWGVVICHCLQYRDERDMRSYMRTFGMADRNINKAIGVLLDERNTGMCVSRDDIRMSLVFIGDATSEAQFWDTVNHELYHVACAVCDYYGAVHGSEDFAWTVGYLTRKAVELFGEPCN